MTEITSEVEIIAVSRYLDGRSCLKVPSHEIFFPQRIVIFVIKNSEMTVAYKNNQKKNRKIKLLDDCFWIFSHLEEFRYLFDL